MQCGFAAYTTTSQYDKSKFALQSQPPYLAPYYNKLIRRKKGIRKESDKVRSKPLSRLSRLSSLGNPMFSFKKKKKIYNNYNNIQRVLT